MQDRAKFFFQNSADLFAVLDKDHLRELNPAWTQTLGWPIDELSARPFSEFIHPEERLRAMEFREQQTEIGKDFRVDFRFLAKNADYRWLELRGNHFEDGTYFIAREVTREKEESRAAAKLRERAFFFQQLVEYTHDAIYLIAPHEGFRFIFVNPAACRHFQLSADKLLEMSIPDWDPNFDLATCEKFWDLLKISKTRTFETLHKVGSGQTVPVEITANYFCVGKDEYIAGFIKDISERKRLDENMEHFAHAVSHDLSEPLRTIASYLQLIERRVSGDKDITEYVAFASDASKRMRALIKGLLDYTRLSQGLKATGPVDLNQVLENAQMNLRRKIEESGAEINNEPLPTVTGDPLLLVQVFQNLLDNAIKYRGKESPRIHISCRRLAQAWEFSVRDNGVGISEANRDRVFRVFQRLNSVPGIPGSGIGLAACKRVVELHDGEITVEPGPLGGSIFRFTLSDHLVNATAMNLKD